MARPREFDVNEALDGATREFWVKGFHGTSLPDLLKAMNLTRGSFYKAFGSKRAVYLAALKRYEESFIVPAVKMLAGPEDTPSEKRIATHFQALVDSCGSVSYRNGCFMCKASVDMAPHDKDVEHAVNRMVLRLERAYAHALEAIDRPPDQTQIPVKARARQLTAMFLGLQVLRNAGTSKAIIKDIVNQHLAAESF